LFTNPKKPGTIMKAVSMTTSNRASMNPSHPARLAPVAWAIALMCATGAQAQSVPESAAAADAGALSPVVVSAERSGGGVWRGAASVDVVGGDELREGQAQVNLSESLGRVPGLVIRNRQNYAQDLQISVRGYGARATFGVRGVRLFVDGIPASAPDGSGQAANFPLGSADRVEVVRGPMAALYGASSGGALLLYTEDGQRPAQWRTGLVAGSDGLWRLSTQATGQTGTAQAPGWSYAVDLSRFETDGTQAGARCWCSTGTAALRWTRRVLSARTLTLTHSQPMLGRSASTPGKRSRKPNWAWPSSNRWATGTSWS
jgi:iron complex outermembrane receptor protein